MIFIDRVPDFCIKNKDYLMILVSIIFLLGLGWKRRWSGFLRIHENTPKENL